MRRVARHVVVTGRVQGVFFRASTRDHARDAGAAGWVRNRPDGAVEAHIEGPEDAVEQLEAWIRAGGPPGAVVDDVTTDEVAPTGAASFTIAR